MKAKRFRRESGRARSLRLAYREAPWTHRDFFCWIERNSGERDRPKGKSCVGSSACTDGDGVCLNAGCDNAVAGRNQGPMRNNSRRIKGQRGRLVLIFTCGVSLEGWFKSGILDREVKPYLVLANNFQEIVFFTYGTESDLLFGKQWPTNVKIIPQRLRVWPFVYSLILPLYSRKWMRGHTILKTNQMAGAWLAVLARLLYRKKLVVRCGYEWSAFLESQRRNAAKRFIVSLVEWITYKVADVVVLTSEADKRFVREKYRLPEQKIKVIPNYIDTDLFCPSGGGGEEGRVLFVGRLVKEKNLFSLIEAVAGTRCTLIMVGQGSMENELRAFSQKTRAQVVFKGIIDNSRLPAEYNQASMFILPSTHEGCPKALLEAMSCGLPCIGSDVHGIKSIIDHRENGFLCHTDTDSIRRAIVELSGDAPLRQRLSANARKTIVDKYGLDKAVGAETQIYEDL